MYFYLLVLTSVEQCLVKCAIDTKCKWSTYSFVKQECLFYTNCLTIDDSYIDDKTNERECVSSKLYEKILIERYTRAHKLAHISYGLLHKHP